MHRALLPPGSPAIHLNSKRFEPARIPSAIHRRYKREVGLAAASISSPRLTKNAPSAPASEAMTVIA